MTGELVAQLTGRSGRKIFDTSILAQTAGIVKAFGEGEGKNDENADRERAPRHRVEQEAAGAGGGTHGVGDLQLYRGL